MLQEGSEPMTDASTIGERLRAARTARGMKQEELAEAADLSRDLIAKLEQGVRKSARLTSLIKLANALDVELSALVGKRDRLGTDRDGGSVLALRDAILSPSFLPDLDDGYDGEPTPVEELQAAVDAAWHAYWAGEFGPLLARIPGLVAESRLAHSAFGVPAVRVLAQSYDLGANLLVQLGRNDLAAIASERAIVTAHGGNDELLWATMHGTYSWLLLHQARLAEAERVAGEIAARIEPSFSSPPPHLAAWGNLLVTALAPAAAAGRDVSEYISMASAAGERLGERVPVFHTSFGPASAAMQAVHAYTVRREPGKALKAAGRLRPGDLQGISQGAHLLDVAQAHVDARHYKTAAERLLEARSQSAVWFRHQVLARDLVEGIREEDARPSPAVRSLAHSLSI
ncbi:helix-turn-helix domain-containing protein [Nonomuraea insulae]|uniref:Helix-turn-helix domain-containing protein n=1 Tax=Nonomuraea insulae TaxID=1616787 RepID=A0ABW1CHA4_9ACTN